jgi:hypothetical protein
MLYSTADQMLSIALGIALIASNGLNVVADNRVANQMLIATFLILLPLNDLSGVTTYNLGKGTIVEDVSLMPLVIYSMVLSARTTDSPSVSSQDRDKATAIASVGLVCTIVLNLLTLKRNHDRSIDPRNK